MKRIIFSIFLVCMSFTLMAQTTFPKGIKVGRVKTGTSVITVDSITQYSTGDVKFWKGAAQLSPNLPAGFKIGTVAVPGGLTATELGYVDGATSALQTQMNAKVDTLDLVDPWPMLHDSIYFKDEVSNGVARLQFIANVTTDAPVTGDSIFIQSQFAGKHVKLIRAGAVQYQNTTATNGRLGFRLDAVNGIMTVRPAFSASELVQIEITNESNWSYPTIPVTQNLLTYSEELDNAVWGKVLATVTPNDANDLTGRPTLDKVYSTDVPVRIRYTNLGSNVTVEGSTTYRLSLDVKKGEFTMLNWSVYDAINEAYIINEVSYLDQVPTANTTRVNLFFTTPSNCTSVLLYPLFGTNDSYYLHYAWFGRLQLDKISSNYVKTTTTAKP